MCNTTEYNFVAIMCEPIPLRTIALEIAAAFCVHDAVDVHRHHSGKHVEARGEEGDSVRLERLPEVQDELN